MNPLGYDTILVNEGKAWIADINVVVIPYTGYYLVHFGAGVPAGARFHQVLYSSGTIVTTLSKYTKNRNGVDSLGKTVIRRFMAGSVLKISNGYNIFSNAQKQATFMGLLLYEG